MTTRATRAVLTALRAYRRARPDDLPRRDSDLPQPGRGVGARQSVILPGRFVLRSAWLLNRQIA